MGPWPSGDCYTVMGIGIVKNLLAFHKIYNWSSYFEYFLFEKHITSNETKRYFKSNFKSIVLLLKGLSRMSYATFQELETV